MTDYKKQGKRNRQKGAEFERRVRKDLESKGWIVSKWQNNIDLENNKLKPASPSRFRLMQTGYPDFIIYKKIKNNYDIQFVEVKTNGYLSKEEKAKSKWYLDNKYCSKFLIAKKVKEKNRIKIEYREFTSE